MKEDIKFDSGLNAKNSRIERIKVIKINAVYRLNPHSSDPPKYSNTQPYWYYPKTGMVYDFTTHYQVGRIAKINSLPEQLDKDTYIMTDVIPIPNIKN